MQPALVIAGCECRVCCSGEAETAFLRCEVDQRIQIGIQCVNALEEHLHHLETADGAGGNQLGERVCREIGD